MGRRAALEDADASFAKSRICTIAGGKTRKHDILDHRLERRRKADNIALAIGQESDGKPVGQQTVWHFRQFERLVVPVHLARTCRATTSAVSPPCSLIDITP